jgi:hypothetical protein
VHTPKCLKKYLLFICRGMIKGFSLPWQHYSHCISHLPKHCRFSYRRLKIVKKKKTFTETSSLKRVDYNLIKKLQYILIHSKHNSDPNRRKGSIGSRECQCYRGCPCQARQRSEWHVLWTMHRQRGHWLFPVFKSRYYFPNKWLFDTKFVYFSLKKLY